MFVAGLACKMVKNREREQTVNKLNTLAKKCGLDGVSKQASKKVVLALGKAIQDSEASVQHKAQETAALFMRRDDSENA